MVLSAHLFIYIARPVVASLVVLPRCITIFNPSDIFTHFYPCILTTQTSFKDEGEKKKEKEKERKKRKNFLPGRFVITVFSSKQVFLNAQGRHLIIPQEFSNFPFYRRRGIVLNLQLTEGFFEKTGNGIFPP